MGNNKKNNSDLYLHRLFEQKALEYSDCLSIVSGDYSITYNKLNEYSNQVARFILYNNLAVGIPVGICMDRSPLAVITLLGILKSGCPVMALNISDPVERHLYKLSDSSTGMLLTERKYAKQFASYNGKIECLTYESDIFSKFDSSNIGENEIKLEPDNLAYIIYTSGSTGYPKGVLNEHRNITRHIHSFIDLCELTCKDNVLGFAPFNFDASIEEIYAILCSGGRLNILAESLQTNNVAVKDCLLKNKITVLSAPPAILNLLNNDESFIPEDSLIRLILTGGDVLKNRDIDRLVKKITVMNGYGLTETTISSLWHVIKEIKYDNIPIGKPIKGRKVYILDNKLQPLPCGEIGEIFLGGDAIARGYLNDPQTTEEKFLPDPFSSDACARMFRTGDMGNFLSDGSVQFHGRIDRQVSIRGFRVELGEIENILNCYTKVNDVVVMHIERDQNSLLAAYLVTECYNELKLNKLRVYLKKHLPEYMIPSEFYIVDYIPRNQSGKIDYQALKKGKSSRLALMNADTRPLSKEEIEIRRIWSGLLQVDESEIPVDSNFFEVGGNSLLATRLISSIRQLYGPGIMFQEILQEATVENQAKYLAYHNINNIREPPVIKPVAKQKRYPLSSAQLRIWFLSQIEMNRALYNTVSADKIKGKLDSEVFCKAFDVHMKQHPLYSVCFELEAGVPYQTIRQDLGVRIEVISLENLSQAEKDNEYRKMVEQELDYKFNLETDILVRAYLIKNNSNSHIFLLNVHHIITDNWSWKLMLSELEILYKKINNKASISGKVREEAEQPLEYFDFIAWEKKYLLSSFMSEQKDYWLAKLAGELPFLDLPAFQPRPSVLGTDGAAQKRTILKNKVAALKNLTMSEGITFYAALLAIFKILLYKYTGHVDIIVGSLVANRNLGGSETILGLFLNTIALRDLMNPELTLSEFMKQVHRTIQEAMYHQDFPFEKIVEYLNPERDLSHSPIFQVIFDYHGDDSHQFELDGLDITSLPIYSRHAKNELTVTAAEHHGNLVLDFEYNTDLFNDSIIERMIDHYLFLWDTILANPLQKISECEILTESEKHYLLYEYNKSTSDYPLEKCLHEVFEQQVEKTPDNTAYIYLENRITYSELNIQANKIAGYLRCLEVKPEIIVAVCLEKSLRLPAVLLGILKAGGAYLPLDPDYPPERINKMLNASGAALLVTKQCYTDYFNNYEGKILILEDVIRNCAGVSGRNLNNLSKPDNIFNIIFTSASTGEPKGVMMTIKSVMNRIYWAWEKYPFNEHDVIANQKSYVLVGSFWEIFGGLLYGVPTVIIPRAYVMDPQLLWNELIANKITYFFASPPLLSGLIMEAENNSRRECCLRLAATSAEPITPQMVEMWKKAFPQTKLLNLYGSTEDCSDVSVFDTDFCKDNIDIVPVGQPLSNTRIYVLDNYRNLVPLGVVGEIHVAGIPVAKGYLNDPVQTTDKFINDPYAQGSGDRMYATGDLGLIMPDGNLKLVGRRDHQVKIRGYRIELGEIELELKQHPFILSAGVKIYTSGENKKIVAYIVFKDGQEISAKNLRGFLKQKIPAYMIPHSFIVLQVLPLTPNGKIDRLSLPDPSSARSEVDTDYVEPRSPNERSIAEIWQDLLKIDKIGVYDNFFTLGGDSLTAIQLLGHLRHIFLINVPLMVFFEGPTIKDINAYLCKMQGIEMQEFYDIWRGKSRATYPLAFIQESFWFYHQLEPKNIFYNIAANRIKGKFQLPLFKKALEQVAANHNALRMLFKTSAGTPYITIKESVEVEIPVVDLEMVPDDKKNIEMMRLSREDISNPFDLENGPLLRVKLFKYDAEDHVVLINMHHIVSDGWSINILLNQVSELYYNYLRNPFFKIALPEIQYTDYIVWQKEKFSKELMRNQMAYWKKKLGGTLPVLKLRTDKKRPELVTYKGGILQFTLDKETTESLRLLGRQYRCTLYMVLLSVYKTVLYRYTGQEDMIVGSPIAGRGHPQIENVIGCFVNTLVMRTKVKGELKFIDLLSAIRTTTLEAFTNSFIPFDTLVSELNPRRDISRSPIFQTMMTMQDKPVNVFDLPGLSVSDAGVINDLAPYDLSVLIWVEKNETTFYVEYYADIFEEKTIARLMSHFRNILFSILANPSQHLDEIPMLTTGEKEEIIQKWISAKDALILDKTLKDALANQFIELNNDFETAKFFVLDNNLVPVPPGCLGKLYLEIKENTKGVCLKYPFTDGIDRFLFSTGKDVFYNNLNVIYADESFEVDHSAEKKATKEFLVPKNEIEKNLLNIWSDVLKIELQNTQANFFDVGGNSMMLMEIAIRINQIYAKNIKIIELFKYPTISSLAQFLQKEKEEKNNADSVNQKVQKQLAAMNKMSRLRRMNKKD